MSVEERLERHLIGNSNFSQNMTMLVASFFETTQGVLLSIIIEAFWALMMAKIRNIVWLGGVHIIYP